jgi:hypothetical protein
VAHGIPQSISQLGRHHLVLGPLGAGPARGLAVVDALRGAGDVVDRSQLCNPRHRHVHGLGQFTVGGSTSQPHLQRRPRAPQLDHPLGGVHRHPDRPAVVVHAALDGLADPPGGVGRELEIAAPVELVDGPDQPDGAVLDQVGKRHAVSPEVLGDRYHQAQVGFDHAPPCAIVSGFDEARQLPLLVLVEQSVASYFGQIYVERLARECHRRVHARSARAANARWPVWVVHYVGTSSQ